jgi:hypothetical protein
LTFLELVPEEDWVCPTLVGRGQELTVMAEFVSDHPASGRCLLLPADSGAVKGPLPGPTKPEAPRPEIGTVLGRGIDAEEIAGTYKFGQALMLPLDQEPLPVNIHRFAVAEAVRLEACAAPKRVPLLAGADRKPHHSTISPAP